MSADGRPEASPRGAAREFEPHHVDSLDSGEPEARSRIHAYAETGTGCHVVPLDDAAALVRDPAAAVAWAPEPPPFVWIDVANPGEAEAAFLRERLGFHPLAVEDCVRGRQRPKLDRYPDHFFLVMYAARINHARNRMALNELHVFLGRHFIVTVHDHRIDEFREVLARWRAAPSRFRGVGAVAHALLDAVVDDYFPVIDHFSEKVAAAESQVFARSAPRLMEEIVSLRRELTLFRRVVGPERDLLGSLVRRDLPFQSPDLLPYFQDVHDHAMRVVEEIDVQRDLLAAALEGQLSMASNQLNATMRLMAAWSIILMAMAWIAGVYGMNFRHMPELEWGWGYAWALGAMLGIGLGLFAFFRRRGWI